MVTDYTVAGVGRDIRAGLEALARAIERYSVSRDAATAKSLESMGDEKLARLERVLEGLQRLRES